eukprot:TRINITY_DN713_c0_g1_i1.p1 TRINITY_DN713_c0_g1~~TRINITY_DN713_c0_g1_i1.p1  ORF type:complete len:477 (-),score=145.23 TRINITY_DN713_c0_g1_i1:156-1586(-)
MPPKSKRKKRGEDVECSEEEEHQQQQQQQQQQFSSDSPLLASSGHSSSSSLSSASASSSSSLSVPVLPSISDDQSPRLRRSPRLASPRLDKSPVVSPKPFLAWNPDLLETDEWSFSDLRRLCKNLGLSGGGKRTDLVARLREWHRTQLGGRQPSSINSNFAILEVKLDDPSSAKASVSPRFLSPLTQKPKRKLDGTPLGILSPPEKRSARKKRISFSVLNGIKFVPNKEFNVSADPEYYGPAGYVPPENFQANVEAELQSVKEDELDDAKVVITSVARTQTSASFSSKLSTPSTASLIATTTSTLSSPTSSSSSSSSQLSPSSAFLSSALPSLLPSFSSSSFSVSSSPSSVPFSSSSSSASCLLSFVPTLNHPLFPSSPCSLSVSSSSSISTSTSKQASSTSPVRATLVPTQIHPLLNSNVTATNNKSSNVQNTNTSNIQATNMNSNKQTPAEPNVFSRMMSGMMNFLPSIHSRKP